MTIAITGATGQLGRLLIKALQSQLAPQQLVALARRPAAAEDLGSPVREFDYNRQETLAPALQGVRKLVLISSSEIGRRVSQHRQVIDAAITAGVSHIIYTSLLHADRSPLSLAPEHLATEQDVMASGLDYTLLRNGWYTENYTASIPAAVQHGAYVSCAGKARIASASRADYADAAARVALSEGHQGKTYELAGDQAWTLSELAAEVSRQIGREIPYQNVSEVEYAALLLQAGLPEAIAYSIASWNTAAGDGALDDDSRQLSQLLGRRTTPLAATITASLS